MDREMIIVLDFGGQYNQLIARRVRECSVYCEVHPYDMSLEKIKEMNPKGIIFTGGPDVVFEDGAPRCSKVIFELGIPVLGICYGAQLMSYLLDGVVKKAVVMLDEPRCVHCRGSGGLPYHCAYRFLSSSRHGVSGEEFLCGAVPP